MSNKPTGWSISGSLILLKLHVLSSLLTSVHACMHLRRKNCTSGRRCFFINTGAMFLPSNKMEEK